MVTLKDFLLALESQNHLVEHKQKHCRKVLLSSFHPKTQKLEPHLVQHNKQYHRKVLLSSFHLNGHT